MMKGTTMEKRIVAAVIHNDTGELEVITETIRDKSNFKQEIRLHSVWIDMKDLIPKEEG
jgi:hypothetical protein